MVILWSGGLNNILHALNLRTIIFLSTDLCITALGRLFILWRGCICLVDPTRSLTLIAQELRSHHVVLHDTLYGARAVAIIVSSHLYLAAFGAQILRVFVVLRHRLSCGRPKVELAFLASYLRLRGILESYLTRLLQCSLIFLIMAVAGWASNAASRRRLLLKSYVCVYFHVGSEPPFVRDRVVVLPLFLHFLSNLLRMVLHLRLFFHNSFLNPFFILFFSSCLHLFFIFYHLLRLTLLQLLRRFLYRGALGRGVVFPHLNHQSWFLFLSHLGDLGALALGADRTIRPLDW